MSGQILASVFITMQGCWVDFAIKKEAVYAINTRARGLFYLIHGPFGCMAAAMLLRPDKRFSTRGGASGYCRASGLRVWSQSPVWGMDTIRIGRQNES